MSVMQDPTGAVINLWEILQEGSEHADPRTPGAIGWNELRTTDNAKAEKFYTELFGWTAQK